MKDPASRPAESSRNWDGHAYSWGNNGVSGRSTAEARGLKAMTQAAGFGPPGETGSSLAPASHGDYVPDPKMKGKYRCRRHNLRLDLSGSVLECLRGCRVHPPAD